MSLEVEEETPSASSISVANNVKPAPVDLLDEYWFFHNSLNTRRLRPRPPPSPNKGKESVVGNPIEQQATPEEPSEGDRFPSRQLLRTPPPPPPRVGREETAREEVADHSKSSNPKLRYSFSMFDSHHHPHPSSKSTAPHPCTAGRRPQRDIRVEGTSKYCANQHCLIREANHRKAFHQKKWKSSSDLEFIEVQGFKDLGFVFDEQELSASLANVIPGLRDRKAGEGDDGVRRPYLSEAWLVQRSAPPTIKWVDKRSAPDMKEQLKSWARAVACNVQHEL